MDALKALQGNDVMEEPPIDEALMTRIQGAVFKTLRPRSIHMHLEARRQYRDKKRKEERLQPERVVVEKKSGVERRHQQWVDALN